MKKVVTAHIIQRYDSDPSPGGFSVDLSSFDRSGRCFLRATSAMVEFSSEQDESTPIFKLVLLNSSASSDSVIVYKGPDDSVGSALGYTPIASIQQLNGGGANSIWVYFTDSNSTPIIEIDYAAISANMRFAILGSNMKEITTDLRAVYVDLEFTFGSE